MAVIEISDEGRIAFKIGAVTQEVDVYAVFNLITDAQQAADDEGRAGSFLPRVVQILEDAGFGRVSQFAADAFVQRLNVEVTRLGKSLAGEPTPGSPASTERPS